MTRWVERQGRTIANDSSEASRPEAAGFVFPRNNDGGMTKLALTRSG
jgi:hypothetical protein